MSNLHEKFPYDRLNDDEIRLLKLRPGTGNILEGELLTGRLLPEVPDSPALDGSFLRTEGDEPSATIGTGGYDAISYFWGDGESQTKIIIYHHGQDKIRGEIPIKPNLENALKTFRTTIERGSEKYFWIDAICIHQEDRVEKSKQIEKMADIYNQADKVRVWLGSESKTSNLAMEFIRRLQDLDDIDKLSTDIANDSGWAALRDMMRSEWFSRRWIIQEIALARQPVLYQGHEKISWEDFTYAMSLFSAKAVSIRRLFTKSSTFNFNSDFLGEVDALGAKILVDMTTTLFRKGEEGDIVEHLLPLEALMSRLTMFEASNPHDTVYAILWLAHDATPGAAQQAATYQANAHSRAQSPQTSPYLAATQMSVEPEALSPISINQGYLNANRHSASTLLSPTYAQTSQSMFPPQPVDIGSPQYLRLPNSSTRHQRSNSMAMRSAEEGIRRQLPRITVDYDKDLFDVYKDFLEFVIRRSRFIDIICKPWAAPPSPERQEVRLPSWIPQLSRRAYALHPTQKTYQRVKADSLVGNPGTGVRGYNACGPQRAYNTDSPLTPFIVGRTLLTRGFVIGVAADMGHVATRGVVPSDWLELVEWEDPTAQLPQQFLRTLVADRDYDGISPPPAHWPLACKWAFKQRISDYHLDLDSLVNNIQCPDLCVTFLRRVQAVIWERRLFHTEGKQDARGDWITKPLLVLGPGNTEKGDLVCILYGCSVPVILREKTNDRNIPPSLRRANLNRKDTGSAFKRKATANVESTHPKLPRGNEATGTVIITTDPSGRATGSSSTTSHHQHDGTGLGIDRTTSSQEPDSYTNHTSVPATNGLHLPDNSAGDDASPSTKQYELIGECYVHGMMAGEAFKHRELTNNEKRIFQLV